MAVRTTVLALAGPVGAATTTLFTCPSGRTAIVKSLASHNRAGAASTFTYRVNRSGLIVGFHQAVVAAGGVNLLSEAFVVLAPGDVLDVVTTGTTNAMGAFGALLVGVAP